MVCLLPDHQNKANIAKSHTFWGFPGGSDGKESACNAGDLGSIPRSGRSPGEGTGNPLPVFLPGEFHGQRRLAGYSQWGRKELDMTGRVNTFTSLSVHIIVIFIGYCRILCRVPCAIQ